MHELSIAYSLVEIAVNAATSAGAHQVDAVRLRLGVMAGVVSDALLFSFDIAAEGTLLQGARLEIEEVPLAIYCPSCDVTSTLVTLQGFRCPQCGQVSTDLRQGREIELVSLEIMN